MNKVNRKINSKSTHKNYNKQDQKSRTLQENLFNTHESYQ